MSTGVYYLDRNLKKTILRGDPWLYSSALDLKRSKISKSGIAKVLDKKGNFVAWAADCPNSVLRLRILTLNKKPFNQQVLKQRLTVALGIRTALISPDQTNCYRLINGEGDRLPGLICDIYDSTLVVQFDGDDMHKFWTALDIYQHLHELFPDFTIYYKPRHDSNNQPLKAFGENQVDKIEILENLCKYSVDAVSGQKTGFFLDQRDNRALIKQLSKDKAVLNLFSYTGGFSVAAGCGGARRVVSVDRAKDSLERANVNWALNQLDKAHHSTQCEDLFEDFLIDKQGFDIVICDPPSLAKSEKHKESATQKYIQIFSQAAKNCKPGGFLALSSCSSHISFEDFFHICQESLSTSRLTGRFLNIQGQGSDHPFPHVNQHLRYLKFFLIQLDENL